MNKTLKLRASAVDLAWECAESIVQGAGNGGKVRITTAGEAADLGTAFHKWAERIDADERPDTAELAARYRVKAEELDRLCAYACMAWQELRVWFEGGDSELALDHRCPFPNDATDFSHLELRGTADRVVVVGPEAHILDWKTGYLEGYEHQQRAYAFMLTQIHPELEVVHTVTAYVRLYFWEPKSYTRNELEDWFGDLVRRLRNGLGQFRPGNHCGHCPRRFDCPGAAEYTRGTLALVHTDDREMPRLTDKNKHLVGPDLCETYRRIRYIEARCAEFKKALKNEIKKVRAIPDGNGRALGITTSQRRSIDARAGWPVLMQYLDDSEINAACTVSLRKCQDALAAKMPNQKGEARRSLLAELEEANAIRTSVVESIREIKEPVHKEMP